MEALVLDQRSANTAKYKPVDFCISEWFLTMSNFFQAYHKIFRKFWTIEVNNFLFLSGLPILLPEKKLKWNIIALDFLKILSSTCQAYYYVNELCTKQKCSFKIDKTFDNLMAVFLTVKFTEVSY